MRVIDSSHGPEWVEKQNKRLASEQRLGVWVSTLESLAFQLVRAGRDFKTSTFCGPAPLAAYHQYRHWAREQLGKDAIPDNLPEIVRQEPAGESDGGRALVERIDHALKIPRLYDLALGASSAELPGDFEHLWQAGLEPWIEKQRSSFTA